MIHIKTPKFFYNKSFIFPLILLPIAMFFGLISMILYIFSRQCKKLKKTKVICVGNFILGGAGKTPVCMAIAKYIIKNKNKCCVITLGYGRNNNRKHFIKKGNPANLTSDIVGDEPLLLSKYCDVFVVNKRYEATDLIEEYDFVICDDGLMDKHLFYDIKIGVLSQVYGFGNGHICPAGPMRTFFAMSYKLSDCVLVIQDKILENNLNIEEIIDYRYLAKKKVSQYLRYFAKKSKLFTGKVIIKSKCDKSKKYFAFAGLGNNDKFFQMLEDSGYNVVHKKYYCDHNIYQQKDIDYLKQEATILNATLITTEKDYVKIKHLISDFPIEIVSMEINIDENTLQKIIYG